MDGGPFEHVRIDETSGPGDDALYDRLTPPVAEWWRSAFGSDDRRDFTRPQRGSLPAISAGEHTLISAPTGTGKTLAAFIGIIDNLVRRRRQETLGEGIRCLYIAPMRALANDITRNLERPLEGIAAHAPEDVEPLRHALRHGDSTDYERRQLRESPPHVLATTPESLAIMLNAPSMREHLASVEYVVVDELHAIANQKRGVHLAVSLERLTRLCDIEPVRIGCSATVRPLEDAAALLVGAPDPESGPRPCRIVDAHGDRPLELTLEVPTAGIRSSPYPVIRDRLFDRLDTLVANHETTLVFANSRAGAERILEGLRDRFDGYDRDHAACHHGSLGPTTRERVESRLKAGTYDLVTTSTSLELGIDMSSVDLVVQLGSAKSVATLLQRVGRSGHHVGATRRGHVIVTDPGDLLEAASQVRLALADDVEPLRVPDGPRDVAIQHCYGMAVAGPVAEAAVVDTVRRAYPYWETAEAVIEDCLAYLAAEDPTLEQYHVYPKIWRDRNDPPSGDRHRPEFDVDEPILGSRGRLAKMIYYTNVGTIPDEFACQVRTIDEDEWVGELDDAFLDALEPGDVFVLGGDRFAFRYRKGGTIYVDRTDASPTVPQWQSERRPTTAHLAADTRRLAATLDEAIASEGPDRARQVLRDLGVITDDAVRAIVREIQDERRSLDGDGVVTDTRICIEEVIDQDAGRRRYFVRTRAGGGVNEALARVLADRSRRRTDANVPVAFGDDGFALAVPINCRLDLEGTLRELARGDVRAELSACLRGSELFDRHFRMNATRSLLVLRQYGEYERTPAEQQFKSDLLLQVIDRLPAAPPLAETYRELLEDRLDIDRVESLLARIDEDTIELRSVVREEASPAALGLLRKRNNEGLIVETDGETRTGSPPAVGQ